jgi:hypothetical protein
MKRFATITASFLTLILTVQAIASDAETSATAGSSRGQANGTAAATARYQGDQGFARTDTRSGAVNIARGVAVGVDRSGLSLSVSNAFASKYGPAVATNFNLSIGLDGRVSSSTGVAVSNGPLSRSASAGGQTATGGRGAGAISQASGHSDPLGRVTATTRADDYRPRGVVVVREPVRVRPVRVVRAVGAWR